jgi:hypothetical protein
MRIMTAEALPPGETTPRTPRPNPVTNPVGRPQCGS